MDIEQELQGILEKYHYTGQEEEFRRNVYQEIRNILRETCESGKVVAIKCAGVHTAHLLEDFSDVLRLDFILDKNPELIRERIKTRQIPVIQTLSGNRVDKVIISSYELREECVRELAEETEIEIIEIYRELEKRGYVLTKSYYNYLNEPYKAIIRYQQQYRDNSEKRANVLNRLIGSYLDIRDIHSALKGIEEYIDQKYTAWETMQALQDDLKGLVNRIQNACHSRQQRDILWFWQDALPFQYCKEMDHLNEAAEKGIFFEEAHSSSWVTRSVYARMLDQQEEYDIYSNQSIWPKQHKTIEFLKESGYDCEKITCMGQSNVPLDSFDLHNAYVLMQPCTAPELWWEGLRTLLSSERPVFLLLHTGVETHAPMFSPALTPEECVPVSLGSV